MEIAACGAGLLFFVLWRDYLLYAVAASALLLGGGATLLPRKNVYLHGLALGLCLGAFVGGAIGALKYIGPEAKVTSKLLLEPTRAGGAPLATQLQC